MITYRLEEPDINIKTKLWTCAYPVVHNHTFHEITFVCGGTVATVIDGKERVMKKYDICLVKPHNVHSQIPQHSENPEFHNVVINSSYLKTLCDSIYDGAFSDIENSPDLFVSLTPDKHAKILKLLNSAIVSINQTYKSKCLSYAVALLIPEFISPLEKSTDRSPLANAMKIMVNPKTMNLSIKEIAAQIGYTAEHFSRLFNKEYNTSPQKLFFDIKMQHVKLLLKQTDIGIEEIARSVGINSLPYFYKAFKKYYNTTPMEMRKSLIGSV